MNKKIYFSFRCIKIFFIIIILFFLEFTSVTGKRLSIYEKNILYNFDTLKDYKLKPEGKVFTSIENFFPAPRSKAYLSIRAYKISNEKISIQFKNPIPITDFIETISVWIYGFYLPASGYLTMTDNIHKKFYISLGTIKYRGWKRISVPIPEGFFQEDLYLKQNKPVYITGITFIPFSENRTKKSFLIWIDDIIIKTRKRYLVPKNL